MLNKHFFLFLKEYITNFVHHPPLQSSTQYGCKGGNGLELTLSVTLIWILLQPLFRLLYLLIVIYSCILLPLDLVFQEQNLVDILGESSWNSAWVPICSHLQTSVVSTAEPWSITFTEMKKELTQEINLAICWNITHIIAYFEKRKYISLWRWLK